VFASRYFGSDKIGFKKGYDYMKKTINFFLRIAAQALRAGFAEGKRR